MIAAHLDKLATFTFQLRAVASALDMNVFILGNDISGYHTFNDSCVNLDQISYFFWIHIFARHQRSDPRVGFCGPFVLVFFFFFQFIRYGQFQKWKLADCSACLSLNISRTSRRVGFVLLQIRIISFDFDIPCSYLFLSKGDELWDTLPVLLRIKWCHYR